MNNNKYHHKSKRNNWQSKNGNTESSDDRWESSISQYDKSNIKYNASSSFLSEINNYSSNQYNNKANYKPNYINKNKKPNNYTYQKSNDIDMTYDNEDSKNEMKVDDNAKKYKENDNENDDDIEILMNDLSQNNLQGNSKSSLQNLKTDIKKSKKEITEQFILDYEGEISFISDDNDNNNSPKIIPEIDQNLSIILPSTDNNNPQMIIQDINDSSNILNSVNDTTKFSIYNQSFIRMSFDLPEEYMEKSIRGIFTKQISSFGNRLLDCSAKKKEISEFVNLLAEFRDKMNNKKFENAAYGLYKSLNDKKYKYKNNIIESKLTQFNNINASYDEYNRSIDYICIVHDNSINIFTLKFTDLYVNIINNSRNSLEALANFLREKNIGYIQEFIFENRDFKKRVVFRFKDGTFDFIIKNNIHLHQSRDQLISLYASLDERFKIIGAFISYWAYQRRILNERYLHPHALYFMIIFFLMIQTPPILPNLYNPQLDDVLKYKKRGPKIKGKNEYYMIEGIIDFNFERDITKIKKKMQEIKNKNNMNVGELVTKFFYTFAFDIPNSKMSITIKGGKLIPQTICQDLGYSVIDPFVSGYDLCKFLTITSQEFIVIKEEFERAYKCIAENNISKLCDKFNGQSNSYWRWRIGYQLKILSSSLL